LFLVHENVYKVYIGLT